MTSYSRRQMLKQSTRWGTSALLASSALPVRKAYGLEESKRPNIVFIIADDLGWADIGYNNPHVKTPNMDRLAREGVILTHHYAMPTCTPTRVGIMTGHYPSRYGVVGPDYGRIFRDETVTLPAALQQNNYSTAISGKWHMGSPPDYTPLKYGFDSSYGYFHGQIDPYTHHYKTGVKSWHRNDEYLEEEGHATDLITDEAVRVIEADHEKPFFLYVAYSVPHFPLKEPDEWTSLYPDEEDVSRQWFNASVSHMDDGIGKIVDALDEKGIREDTLIVFVSDNGGQKSWSSQDQYGGDYADKPHTVLGDNEPLRGWKGDVFEGGVRVPAFVNWKGTLDSGSVDMPIHIADWMPTLCAVTNAEPELPLEWDGVNVWSAIDGEEMDSSERTMYWKTPGMIAYRKGDWKLICKRDHSGKQLYNLKDDPYETKDVVADNPEILNELFEGLKKTQEQDREKIRR